MKPPSQKAVDPTQVRQRLHDLRAKILAEGDLEIEPARKDASAVGGDEDAAPLTEMNQVIASKRNRERTETLARIDRALRRIEDEPEMLGLCRECEEPIGKRLLVLPYVELCVSCQHTVDAAGKSGRRRHLTDYR